MPSGAFGRRRNGLNLRRSALRLAAAILALAAATSLGACGDEDSPDPGITISRSWLPAHLDPALTSDPATLEALWLVYTPLLTYRHAEGEKGTELIAGLATDLPEISADGLTYTLTLRDGLSYSDGTTVHAGDFEHSIARALRLGSPESTFFLEIAGAREYLDSADPDADISGIEADNETGRITIRLDQPDATFSNILALTAAAPVPQRTPLAEAADQSPPGVGPYEISEYQPGSEFVLTQSPAFADLDIPDIPRGNIARITTRVVPSGQQAQDVLDGKLDSMQGLPPAELKPTILEQASDRYEEHATSSTAYFFLNTSSPPFDDPLVREAVNRGVDRAALARPYAGAISPGCSFLPPGIFGYDQALDGSQCPYGDPIARPGLGAAKALIAQARAKREPVTVWGSDEASSRAVTEAYTRMLRRIGLAARARFVAAADYAAAIGTVAHGAQTGLEIRFAEFPHPYDFMRVVDGDSIQPLDSPNPGNVDDPFIDLEVDRLRASSDPEAEAWGSLDRYLVSPPQSYLVPFGHARVSTFFSERMDPTGAVFHPIYGNDYASWRLKQGE